MIGDDDLATVYSPGYEFYNTLRIDFHLFEDPKDNRTYFAYTGYGNMHSREEAGNHIVFAAFDNFSFEPDAPQPALYYDFDPASYAHASNPLDWPELEGKIPTTHDRSGSVWMPVGGFPRGVTEAPSLAYCNGWYQLYFSCNTWDCPDYQIVCVMAKSLTDLDVSRRKLPETRIRIGRFALPAKGASWVNYGSGGLFTDKDGKLQFSYHVTHSDYARDVVVKEVIW